MSNHNETIRPFLQDGDGAVLAGIVNRVAESLKVAELSNEEVVVTFTLLDHMMSALWEEHSATLLQVFTHVAAYADTDRPNAKGNGSDGEPEF